MDAREIEAWAAGYVEALSLPVPESPEDPNWPYVMGLMPGFSDSLSLEVIWLIILAVLRIHPSDHVLSVLAAGPLEDLVGVSGETFIDRIEIEARRNPNFKHLLGGVWKGGASPEVWSRVEKARGQVSW